MDRLRVRRTSNMKAVSMARMLSLLLLLSTVQKGQSADDDYDSGDRHCPNECECQTDESTSQIGLRCEKIPPEFSVNATSTSTTTTGWLKFDNLTVYGDVSEHEFRPESLSSLVRDIRNLVMDRVGLTSIGTGVDPQPQFVELRTLSLNDNRLLRLVWTTFEWCPNLRELRLAGNGIKELHADVFDALTLLEILDLANNNLQILDFKLMTSLVTLDLSNNQIGKIATGRHGLPNVRTLRLCGNQLETTDELVDVSPAPNLRSLCLGDLVGTIEARSFADTPAIEHLELVGKSNIHVKEIDSLAALRHLARLTLSFYGMAAHFGADVFVGFDELRELRLNNIKVVLAKNASAVVIDSDTFARLVKLEVLNLSGSAELATGFLEAKDLRLPTSLRSISLRRTKLTSVRRLTNLENVTELDVSENPLTCDGHLRELIKLLLGRPTVLDRSNRTTCSAPSQLRGDQLLSTNVVASILLAPQPEDALSSSDTDETSSNGRLSAANGTSGGSQIEAVLRRYDISVDCLFWVTVGSASAALVFLLLAIGLSVCVCMTNGGGGGGGCRSNSGHNKGDAMEGFVRADNEYTFDNFTLSETLAECRRLNNNTTAAGSLSRPYHLHVDNRGAKPMAAITGRELSSGFRSPN